MNEELKNKEEEKEETTEETTEETKEDETKEDETKEDETVKELGVLIDKASSGLEKGVLEKVNAQLEEHKRMLKNKVGAYNPEVAKEEKRKEVNTKFKELASAIVNRDDAKLKEITTGGAGQYIVDEELSAEIRHLVTEYGVARRESMTIQVTKDSYKANNLSSDIAVYYVEEAGEIKSSGVSLGQETLELKKLAVIATMSSELLEEQEIDLFSFIAGRVAETFAEEEDKAFFKGDGTPTYGSLTGLLNNTSVNEVVTEGSTFGEMNADDLINMVDETPQGALGNAKYYLHRSIMSIVRKLKDSGGQYIYQAPSASGPATIWGYPTVLVEAMPSSADDAVSTSFVLFGDLKKATIFGYRGGIEAKRFDAGSVRNIADDGDVNLLTSDQEAIRWIEKFGFIVILPTAITKLTTAAS